MLEIKEYRKVESLEEAWELNQKKANCVIGGMLWLRLGKKRIQTAIDLSGLSLDTIEEAEKEFRIGCMVTLRQMETHEGLHTFTNGAMKEALRHIVGVQFRNLATVGGSIYGRYGFSDVLTMLLVMDCDVELYKGGRMSLVDFAAQKYDRDILVRLIIRKRPGNYVYQSVRNTQTDFPVLTCSAVRTEAGVSMAFGARPAKAVRIEDEEHILTGDVFTEEMAKHFGQYAAEQVSTGSNLRGSSAYRTHLVEVLAQRAVQRLGGIENVG